MDVLLRWEGPYESYGKIYELWDTSMKGIYVVTDGDYTPLYVGRHTTRTALGIATMVRHSLMLS